MKVVLFCGGQGLRLREYSENIPKPMVPIGYRPILWHLMKYYAHFGHREFILCLGYRADVIKEYFLNYNEAVSNDFVLSKGGQDLKLLASDISDWKITFVDTGMESNIGMRLRAVKDYLDGDEMFLANYADNLTDASMPTMIEHLVKQPEKVASFITVKPTQSFHVVKIDNGEVETICPASECGVAINGGFFVLRKEIFDYIKPGEELVVEPFQRLIKEKKLATYQHDGFWACMDTFKEKQILEDLYQRGKSPWEVWKKKLNGDAKKTG
jgi:glucose-1-phosphate cytidylyltransferase